MTTPPTPNPLTALGRPSLRCIAAVFAGWCATVILLVIVDIALHSAGVFPPAR